MSDFKIVYLIVERGSEENRKAYWRPAGAAYVCRDGSLNLKLDMFPAVRFNIREPKSNGERAEAGEPPGEAPLTMPSAPRLIPIPVVNDDDIPF